MVEVIGSSPESRVFGQKREHMIMKTVRHLARVSARIHFEAICDSILIKNFVELYGIGSQTVLVTHIDGDRTMPPETSDVVINGSEWSICVTLFFLSERWNSV